MKTFIYSILWICLISPSVWGGDDTKCEICHQVSGWQMAKFDHSKTNYPLKGAHYFAPCWGCHPNNTFDQKIDTACQNCHTDVHAGQMGRFCQNCHSETGWKTTFTVDAHRRTNFPLTGRHGLIPCTECHFESRDKTFSKTPLQCVACHQSNFAATSLTSVDHVLLGFSKRCQQCHNTMKWKPISAFPQHDGCFPVRGPHAGFTCTECHTSIVGIAFTGACTSGTSFCGACHTGAHSKSRMDSRHSSVPGYQYVDQKCRECHTRGR